MAGSLDESYRHCRDLTRRTARNFYWTFWTLPTEQRRLMCALYAFMRVTDDLGDDETIPLESRIERLETWKKQLSEALRGEPTDHPVLPAVGDLVRNHDVPAQSLWDVVVGVERDLHPMRISTFTELTDYCYHVAGAVGICCIHLWGFHDPRAIPAAVQCGQALQLTNILRDLREDAQRGRQYLPQEDLDRFGYSPQELQAGVMNGAYRDLMAFQVARARQAYQQGHALFDYLNPRGHGVLRAMLTLYGGILAEIETRKYDVFSRRVELSTWKKLTCLTGVFFTHR